MPSPLKSPVPTTDQLVGMAPTLAAEETVAPFMNQIAVLPLVSRHNRSAHAVAVEIALSDDRPSDGDAADAAGRRAPPRRSSARTP